MIEDSQASASDYSGEPARLFPLLFAAASIGVILSRFAALPRTLWESDECLFVAGVLHFDPARHHPHPPGYPLTIGLGKMVVAFVALTFAFRNFTRDAVASVLAATLVVMSPAMLVHSIDPMSDPPAFGFLALALWAASTLERRPRVWAAALFALFSSCAIGCRPQLAVAVVPMLLFVSWRMRGAKMRLSALATFGLVSLLWLAPLLIALGGVRNLVAYEKRQATYVATQDAAASRGAMTRGALVARFVAHPWGPKWLSLPILLAAASGAVVALRRKESAILPVVIFAGFQIVFCLASMDPADGARYASPAMIGPAILIASLFSAIIRRSRGAGIAVAALLVALLAAGSLAYVWSFLRLRATTPSPPVAAADWMGAHLPSNAVVLYDTSLRPHAELLLPQFHPRPIDRGLRDLWNRPDVPLYIFGDGQTGRAMIFSWPASDAYGKLTRNHYRVVSVQEVDPEERYAPGAGIFAIERSAGGGGWRWLASEATAELPAGGAKLRVVFSLPPEAPYAADRVELFAGGAKIGEVDVPRGKQTMAELPLPSGDALQIAFRATQSYVAAAALGNRDPRRLAVQLVEMRRE
jgi:hypothetical protein